MINRRSFVNILGAILGIGLLVALGFVMNGRFREIKTAKEGTPAPSQSQPVSSSQEKSQERTAAPPATSESPEQADPTAGWRVYKNANQGYVIKYPTDWFLYPYGDYVGTVSIISSIDLAERNPPPGEMPVFPGELVVSIGLETDYRPLDQDLQDWLMTRRSTIPPLVHPETYIQVAGTTGVKLVTKNVF